MRYRPDDLLAWLAFIDVNALTVAEQDRLAAIDPSTAEGLRSVMEDWIRPRFDQIDEQNQREFREVLEQSQHWSEPAIDRVFAQVAFPNHELDAAEFIGALRATFLP
jgi:hypothetical protein